MHLKTRNVNTAFETLVRGIHEGQYPQEVQPSRYGEVIRITEPVIITYERPWEKVLFNPARDANCFFHCFEALWMLAGRDDLEPIVYYNSKMSEFSDDGGRTQPDAYGFRWRERFGYDQLEVIADELQENPYSRRCVLSMWDACVCEEAKPLRKLPSAGGDLHPVRHDLWLATKGKGLGVPCNVCAFFDIEDEKFLNMTVCNRSNDLIWGALGANAVHFAFLQEYLASRIGVGVGTYNQFTNNLHVYTERWEPEKYLDAMQGAMQYPYLADPNAFDFVPPPEWTHIPLVEDWQTFDREVAEFIDNPKMDGWDEPFLTYVAGPMCEAFKAHKEERDYKKAIALMRTVKADDWRVAGEMWMWRRAGMYESKKARENATRTNKG